MAKPGHKAVQGRVCQMWVRPDQYAVHYLEETEVASLEVRSGAHGHGGHHDHG